MYPFAQDFFADEELNGLLVACYAIGWRITGEELEEYPHLRFAAGEDDTRVIIAFNSEAEDVTDSLMIPAGTRTLAINPLNWETDGTPAGKEKIWARVSPITAGRSSRRSRS